MVALQLLVVASALGGGGGGETVLLNFTQANCGPCRAMEPVLGQLEAAGLPVQLIDMQQHPEIARRFRVAGSPTFVMLVEGRETKRIVGVTTARELQALFPRHEAPVGEVRGQSPDDAGNNYLGERLGGIIRGQGPQMKSAPPADPFTHRQASYEQPDRNMAVAAEANGGPHDRAVAATVRLKVEDGKGFSIGSGTIIDTHEHEAVLITCGHIFRESKGEGKISVDLFHPQQQTVEGKLLDYDLERDIAIVTIAPGPGVIAAAVAQSSVKKNDPAFSIGCDKGNDPTVRESITSLNRYQGPPNLQAAGQPVDGRSGGGLFSREGQLIGVCNAADPKDDEGIYAALESIHWQLKKVGLAGVLQDAAPSQPAVERLAPANPAPDRFAVNAEASERALAAIPEVYDEEMEVICIVRPKNNPSAKKQVIVIERATSDLLNKLAERASNPTAGADLALQADRRSIPTPVNHGPQVRGQSWK